MAEFEHKILELAASQRGLITRRQAIDGGLTPYQVDYRVRSGRWIAVDDGVYRIAGAPATWEAQLLSHCLAHPAVVSHRSAAELWRLPGGSRDLVEITTFRHCRRTLPEVTWHESVLLDERADVTEVDGIPVTRPARVILDLAGVVEMDAVEAALDNAEARGLTSKSHLLDLLHRRNMLLRPGAQRVLVFLDRRLRESGRPMSEYETRLRQLLRSNGLRDPVAQYELRDVRGLIGYADFAYVDRRIAIEMQSFEWHAGRDSLIRDSHRFARCAAIGWQVVPIVTSDLDCSPNLVVDLIRRTRDQRRF